MNILFSQRSSRWDSLLFPIEDNRFELTLQFRVRLIRIEPTSHFMDPGTYMNGDGFLRYLDGHRTIKLESWADLEWETYKRDFKSVIERNWGDRFVLIPNKPWYTPRAGSAPIPAPIKCSIAIQVVDFADQNPHFKFRCIHFHPDIQQSNFQSYASWYYGLGIITHEDLQFYWRLKATKVGKQQHQVEFGQILVLHEFGHILGFDHVNGESNEDWAYGVTVDQKADTMGIGYHFANRHAEPWERTLKRHLVRENRYDNTVKFIGQTNGPQIIPYWDNNWEFTPTPSASGSNQPVPIDDAVRGPAGVIWGHMANRPITE
ncbi:hypothetical protein [Spirosoma pollinicola]|uniref:Uncharacterized protein n=1 Tax=Spirosoma pollinicola TaxID=2057025 RepID=A0A2K8YU00_9BACT|nr:hypothetical protein [Spirosoma pollinicola]AUD01093.1 hypothetical protein CWM47_04195 [Spirosoma pollinicola]